jgi:hypothetical protein
MFLLFLDFADSSHYFLEDFAKTFEFQSNKKSVTNRMIKRFKILFDVVRFSFCEVEFRICNRENRIRKVHHPSQGKKR